MNETIKELRRKQQEKELLHSWQFYDSRITPLELDLNSIELILEDIQNATAENDVNLLEAALQDIGSYVRAVQLVMDDAIKNVKEMREFNENHRQTEVSLR